MLLTKVIVQQFVRKLIIPLMYPPIYSIYTTDKHTNKKLYIVLGVNKGCGKFVFTKT